jgi:hypothetical protein
MRLGSNGEYGVLTYLLTVEISKVLGHSQIITIAIQEKGLHNTQKHVDSDSFYYPKHFRSNML